MASIVTKNLRTVTSTRLIDGVVLSVSSVWYVVALDDFGDKHNIEFTGAEPTDQEILNRLPRPIELSPSNPADAREYVIRRFDWWNMLNRVKIEAVTRVEAPALIAAVTTKENAAWNDLKAALSRL